MKEKKVFWNLVALAVAWGAPLGIQAGQPGAISESEPKRSALESWWNGKYASGNWFGVRDTLEDHGLKLGVEWKANFLWNVDGGLEQRFGYDDEWKFRGTLDFAKATGWEAIEGLTAYSDLRYRGGAGVNKWVGASSQFAPSTFQGGRLWRFQQVYLTYTTPELFGIKEFLTLSGGWQNPTDIFINQPLNKFFINNTFTSNRGIGANGIRLGRKLLGVGRLHQGEASRLVLPARAVYTWPFPDASTPSNHGLFFAGAQPAEPQRLVLADRDRALRRRSAPPNSRADMPRASCIGVSRTHFLFRTNLRSEDCFYWQVDQQLYREPSPEPAPICVTGPSNGKSIADGKRVQGMVKPSKPKLSEQGLVFLQPDQLRSEV